jgi:hypothetical protein
MIRLRQELDRHGLLSLGCVIVAVSLFLSDCRSASAGMLNDTSSALTHNSIVWKGAVSIPAGTFEYAVFGPGKFDDFLAEALIDPSLDPTNPNLLTYAYQLIDVPSNASVSFISVGETVNHDPAHDGNVVDYPPLWFNPPGGSEQDPQLANDIGTSWAWSFGSTTDTKITSGEVSSILYFQTDMAPEYDQVSASAPFGINSNSVASISADRFVPEPTTACFAAFALCWLLLLRRAVGT